MLRMLTILIYVANIIFSVAGMAIQSTHSRTSHLHFRYSKYMVLIRHIFKSAWDMVGNSLFCLNKVYRLRWSDI